MEHVDLFEQAISAVDELCSQLGPGDWDKGTDCPGWTVKDNLSHLASYESIAAGLADPADVAVDHLSHFKEDFGEANEREVEARRSLAGPQVLEEFRTATQARLKHMRSLDAAGWETDESRFPWGSANTRSILPIRILDVYYHEQDMRRAVGKPGHLDGAVARHAFERMATMALPRVFGKEVAPPEGTSVRWNVPSPGRSFGVVMRDGKGVAEIPDAPTVTFDSDLETMLCLFGGRWDGARALAEGKLAVLGDRELAERILAKITVVP